MPLCEEKTITEARTMDKSELIEKLKKMRLPVIAEQYELQSANPEYSQLSFDERFSELIDMEYDSRVNHTIERFIKNAHFYDSTASMESINYNPDRKTRSLANGGIVYKQLYKQRFECNFCRSIRLW